MADQLLKTRKPRRQVYKKGRWSNDEEYLFEEGLRYFGKDWKKIQQYIKSRTLLQVRSHAQKYFLRLQKLQIESSHLKSQESGHSENLKAETSGQNKTEGLRQNVQTGGFRSDLPINQTITFNCLPVQHCSPNVLFSGVGNFDCNNYFNALGYLPTHTTLAPSLGYFNPFLAPFAPSPAFFTPPLRVTDYHLEGPRVLPHSKQ